jgi:hypothetical protein
VWGCQALEICNKLIGSNAFEPCSNAAQVGLITVSIWRADACGRAGQSAIAFWLSALKDKSASSTWNHLKTPWATV